MCGIFAYANFKKNKNRKEISQILINGLKRMEYRGYDSAGICLKQDDEANFLVLKQKGKVQNLEDFTNKVEIEGLTENHVGIAHTRWATHGEPCEKNSHPHQSGENFFVVHNGIIANYKAIKSFLEKKGYEFLSDTDTEVAAHLADYFYNKDTSQSFVDVIKKVVGYCEGAFAFVFISKYYPNEMMSARKSSPLLIGIKSEGKKPVESLKVNFLDKKGTQMNFENSPVEFILASDVSAIIEHTKKTIFLEDEDLAHVKNGILEIHRMEKKNENGGTEKRSVKEVETELTQIQKGNFDYFMVKEIFEQTNSVMETMRGRVNFEKNLVNLGGIKSNLDKIKKSKRLVIVACGTSYNSGLAVKDLMEELLEIPVYVELASDFSDRKGVVSKDDTIFFISQSGETADSLVALEYSRQKGAFCVGITNTVGSSISRETDCGVHINAGPEIGVASTKAYTSQYIALVLMAIQLSQDNKETEKRRIEIIKGLKEISGQIKTVLSSNDAIQKITREKMEDLKNLIIVGRNYHKSTCLEGALKIKEISYIPTEGIFGGELKHGPLALIDNTVTSIVVIPNDENKTKIENAYHEIVARRGKVILICTEDLQKEFSNETMVIIPKTVDCLQGLLAVIPFQLMSYHLAANRGFDVDKPRNLAKSVTTE